MTRIAVIADSHVDEHSRFEECVRIHDWIARDLTERGVDLVLHAGDVFERKSTPRERMAFASWLRAVAVQAPVVIVRGNHDSVGDLPLFEKLETAHPVIVEEAAAVHVVAGVAVGCLAWPRRAELLAAAGHDGKEATEELAGEAMRSVLTGIGMEMRRHEGPRVLLAHAMVRGSVTSTGQPLVGCDLEIGVEDLALSGADFVALGHIHKGQEWTAATGTPVVYPGSPRRSNFGELEVKAYLVVEIDDAGSLRVERIETPATPMVHLDGTVDASAAEMTVDGLLDLVPGAEVRLRYVVDADQRELGKRLADEWKRTLLSRDAVDVKVEEVVRPTTRARAPEVARSESIADKLAAYWDAKGDAPSAERAEAIRTKLAAIDELVPRPAGSGCPGRFLGVRARNVGPFRSVDIDLTATSGLVAVTGDNGAGKSTLLELLGGAMYRTTPTRGSLIDLSTARDSMVEAQIWNGASYTLRHVLDCVSKKSEAVALAENGRTLTDAGKVREFDSWAEKHLPAREVLYSSTFAPQGSGGFLEMASAARKAVVLRTLGIERIEAMAAAARDRAASSREALRVVEARLADESARTVSVENASAELDAARVLVEQATEAEASAERLVRAAERAAEQAERVARERAALLERAKRLDEEVLNAVRRQRAAKATADRGPEIERARERLAAGEGQLDAARAAASEAQGRLAAAEASAETIRAVLAAAERDQRRLVAIGRELADAERLLAAAVADGGRAGEIAAARAELSEVEERISMGRFRLDTMREQLRGAQVEHAERRAAAADRAKALADAERRAGARVGENVDAARVAATELPAFEQAVADARSAIHRLEAELAATRDAQLDVAGRRINGLRGTLEDIATEEIESPSQFATGALEADDKLVSEAEGAPARIAALGADLVRARRELTLRESLVASAQRLADSLPGIERALAEQAAAAAEADGLRPLVQADRAAVETAEGAIATAIRAIDDIAGSVQVDEGRAGALRKVLASADAVAASAEREQAIRADIARLEAERADLAARPSTGHKDPEGPVREARSDLDRAQSEVRRVDAELSAARRIVADADAVARAAADVDAAEREMVRGETELAEVRRQIATLPIVETLDRTAAQRAAEVAFGEKRAADRRLAAAESALEVATAAQGRLASLRADVARETSEHADWTRLAQDLGKDGLQALAVDAAGPELAAIANDLLHSCVSSRWTIDIRTQRTSSDGKRQIEGCDVLVLDTERGREAEAETFSGGERVLIGEAVSLALSVFACRRLGVDGPSLVRDESGAALSPENGRRYIEMLRRAAATIGADRVLYVSHSPELQELADHVIHVANGTARLVGAAEPAADFALARAAE